ncbi:hypothetical protein [Streptomyces sp. HUAS ZL42]|uniref:hypothetical protein n=1 Tax=Streptomyces sp. HUAS ZL42 TaxID=3231715 RepID=UPI00345ED2F1
MREIVSPVRGSGRSLHGRSGTGARGADIEYMAFPRPEAQGPRWDALGVRYYKSPQVSSPTS